MKKVINVAVHIEMTIDTRLDTVDQVVETLDAMNNIIFMSELQNTPQIFTSNIDSSDILELDEEL